jgi:hypothetical protein
MNAGPKTARGGKRPLTGVFAQPLAGDPHAIFRAAENESFSPEKHVISMRAEYSRKPIIAAGDADDAQ